MAATQQNYSTNAMHYTFRRTAIILPISPAPQRQCTLAVAAVAGREPYRIPCFYCSGLLRTEDYCDLYHQQLITLLRTHFRFIPTRCAKHVADVFMSTVLLPAHETLNFPHHPLEGAADDPILTTVVHRVEINVRPIMHRPREAGVRAMRATLASVRELVVGNITEEFEWDRLQRDRECAICLEKMETERSALKMPCSHVFHQACLVEWLKNGHVCPLCRYEMPCED